MLRQAIENLIDNAAAHGEPAAVEVDVRADPAPTAKSRWWWPTAAPPRRPSGHGIGLFVVRRFLDGPAGLRGLRPVTVEAPSWGCACRCGQPPNRDPRATPSTPERPLGERSMRQPVRVVLADDHDAFVEGLGMVLSAKTTSRSSPWRATAPRPSRPSSPTIPTCWWSTPMPGPAVTELVRLVGQAEPATRVLLLAEDAARPRQPARPGRPQQA